MPPTPLPNSPHASLSDEIHMIRSVMLRVMELSDEDICLGELLKLLDSVSIASTRLASLLKADAQLSKKEDLTDALNRALAELLEEMDATADG